MARPRKPMRASLDTDPYARLSLVVMDALSALEVKNKRTVSLILLVIRETWGTAYRKQFETRYWYADLGLIASRMCVTHREQVSRALKEAIQQRAIKATFLGRGRGWKLKPNPRIDQWTGLPDQFFDEDFLEDEEEEFAEAEQERAELESRQRDEESRQRDEESRQRDETVISSRQRDSGTSEESRQRDSGTSEESRQRDSTEQSESRQRDSKRALRASQEKRGEEEDLQEGRGGDPPTPPPDPRRQRIEEILANVGNLPAAGPWVLEWGRQPELRDDWETLLAQSEDAWIHGARRLGQSVAKSGRGLKPAWALERFRDAVCTYQPPIIPRDDRPATEPETFTKRQTSIDPNVADKWSELLDSLEEKTPSTTFNRWFRPLGARLQNGHLVLQAEDEFDAAFVVKNFAQLIGMHCKRIGLPTEIVVEQVDTAQTDS